ncbi:hypothetical protein [Pseudonocardia sp. H11422]|uniref:hypothetical protein n=1 Tax=Pseudonocardia sp. H11422 TaxID=2835866 RepID=UPI001BDCA270|nr:hypothetical protein [Pseudonocardia sp. H11422]
MLGALLLLIGVVWTLRGAGVVGGSFMPGQRLWLGIGLLCVLAGGALLWAAVRGWRTPRR